MNERHNTAYIIDLRDGGAIRVRFTTECGRVVAFTVQYEPLIDGKLRPAVRYDTAHERPHIDTLDWSGHLIIGQKQWLPEDPDLNAALTSAIQDFKSNWPAYRAAFLRRRR